MVFPSDLHLQLVKRCLNLTFKAGIMDWLNEFLILNTLGNYLLQFFLES